MMKPKSLLLVGVSMMMLSCSNQDNTPANLAPTLVGINDIQCVVNSRIDFLDGIAALDKEDGDLTPKLEISVSPHVDVVDGFATFDKVGEYTVDYKITDSQGRTAQKKSYVDVVARERYVGFDMPSQFTSSTHGKAKFDTCGMVNGAFVVKASGHQIAEDVLINRKFTLRTNLQYTFLFTVNAHCEGKVKALADNDICSEMRLYEGHNVLSFKHIVLAEENENRDVTISLALGDIDGDINLVIEKVETEYPQEEGKLVDLTPNYSFTGNVVPRIENGCEGNAWAEAGGNSAVLEITKPIPEIWLGGMFINTGITTRLGCHYIVSFDLECDSENGYEVFIQRSQWAEKKFEDASLYNPESGHYSREISVDDEHVGPLWLYVQSGDKTNHIRISNLKVEERLGAIGHDTFPIEDFSEFHADNYHCVLSSRLGAFSYHLDSFAPTDGEEKVSSPAFFVAGSGNNYVLSFKAKASKPIDVVVAAPIANGWDPAAMWAKIELSEQEQAYSFFFYDPKGECSNRDYQIVWQFGSTKNQQYENVDVEVSDISICLRNRELDG